MTWYTLLGYNRVNTSLTNGGYIAMLDISQICQPEKGLGAHQSDCAVHDAPAYERGVCNCGAEARGMVVDLSQICQPGERVTIVTKTKVIVTTVTEIDPDQQGFCQGPTTIENSFVVRDQYVAQEPLPDQCDGALTLRTRGIRGCAVDLKIHTVRERGQDS